MEGSGSNVNKIKVHKESESEKNFTVEVVSSRDTVVIGGVVFNRQDLLAAIGANSGDIPALDKTETKG